MGSITKHVRLLRKTQTPSESKLWQELRAKRLSGIKFKRQEPIFYQSSGLGRINYFVADFYSPVHKLIVELDGPIHNSQKDYDENRDSIIRSLGYRMLRIKNEDLNDMPSVLKRILEMIDSLPGASPRPSPKEREL